MIHNKNGMKITENIIICEVEHNNTVFGITYQWRKNVNSAQRMIK